MKIAMIRLLGVALALSIMVNILLSALYVRYVSNTTKAVEEVEILTTTLQTDATSIIKTLRKQVTDCSEQLVHANGIANDSQAALKSWIDKFDEATTRCIDSYRICTDRLEECNLNSTKTSPSG